jgi:hypothetical protein
MNTNEDGRDKKMTRMLEKQHFVNNTGGQQVHYNQHHGERDWGMPPTTPVIMF